MSGDIRKSSEEGRQSSVCTMSPEEINVTIAKACGWTEIYHKCDPQGPIDSWVGKPKDYCHGPKRRIPDFCNDLNAMHEAEKVIRQDHPVWVSYCNQLCERWIDPCDAIHATASERAETFLRCLGLWKEGV